MEQQTLAARTRTVKGKGAARKLRQKEQVPAIFYGPKTEPIMLAVDYPELRRVLKQGAGENALINLQIQSDQGTDTRKVMLKELLTDPIKGSFLHADFYEVSMDKEITTEIQVQLINTPKGVDLGGILQHIRREISISCLPDKLMSHIDVDVSDLEIGDSLHIRDITFPDGIQCLDEGHLTVAVVAAPSIKEGVAEEEAEVETEAEEGAAPEPEQTEKR